MRTEGEGSRGLGTTQGDPGDPALRPARCAPRLLTHPPAAGQRGPGRRRPAAEAAAAAAATAALGPPQADRGPRPPWQPQRAERPPRRGEACAGSRPPRAHRHPLAPPAPEPRPQFHTVLGAAPPAWPLPGPGRRGRGRRGPSRCQQRPARPEPRLLSGERPPT